MTQTALRDEDLDVDLLDARIRRGPGVFVRLGWPVALCLVAGGAYFAVREAPRYDAMRVAADNAQYHQREGERRVQAAEARAVAAETAMRATREEQQRQAVAGATCAQELESARQGCLLAAHTTRDAQARAMFPLVLDAIVGSQGEVRRVDDRLVATVPERAMFTPGTATLTPMGQGILDRLGATLATSGAWELAVHAHTDATPPSMASHLASNWELSSLQAAMVARTLVERARLDAVRVTPVGYGSSRPASPPDAARDPRVELVLTYTARPTAPAATPAT